VLIEIDMATVGEAHHALGLARLRKQSVATIIAQIAAAKQPARFVKKVFADRALCRRLRTGDRFFKFAWGSWIFIEP